MGKHAIPLTLVRQKPALCGPACLEMLFAHYGVKASQHAIARAAGTTRAHGTPPEAMRKAARAFGFASTYKESAELADIAAWLAKGVPVIVDWFSVDDGHYSVAAGLDAKHVLLYDPEHERPRLIPRKEFVRAWFDFAGDRMETRRDLRLRPMLVIHSPARR